MSADGLLVDVKIFGMPIGTLFWNTEKQLAAFEYEKKFLNSGLEISPIIMPLSESKGKVYEFPQNKGECFKGLPGIFADSLPDKFGTSVIDEWFASLGKSAEECTPLHRLCYVGKRAMGALEFEPSENISGLDDSTVLDINNLMSKAREVLDSRKSFRKILKRDEQSIKDILRVGTSAGGAKPKAIIAYNKTTGEIRSGQVKAPKGFEYFLLKFDGLENSQISDNPIGIGNIEYAYYKMATDCGINMTYSMLLPEGDYHHFMTQRFDRTASGEKLHTQTLCAIAHLDRDNRHSYEQGFQAIRDLELSHEDSVQFYRRMVFNVIARNQDDHTKNHSFIMDKGGKWKLAPAYDVCFSHSSQGRWTKDHQMSLNQKRNDFIRKDLLEVAEKMDILRPAHIIDEVLEVVSKWKQYATDCGVKKEHSTQIAKKLRVPLT